MKLKSQIWKTVVRTQRAANEELPTELTISDELLEAHKQYQELRDEIVEWKAVNKNTKT